MSTSAPLSSQSPLPSDDAPGVARNQRTPLLVMVLAVIIPTAVIIGLLWVVLMGTQPRPEKSLSDIIGLTNPIENRLDARFTDANNDLVADPPTDPAELIDPAELVFSYVGVTDPEPYRQAWQGFMDHLARVTGKPVRYGMYTDSELQLRALRDGELHVTGLNTGAVPVAVNRAGFVPVAGVPSDASGGTRTEIIVPADSPIKVPYDLRNRELTLTDATSNSGYKAPLVFLKGDFGLVPGEDFVLRYSGGHDQSVKGIASGLYQAAAVASDLVVRNVAAGNIQPAQYRVVYRSELFPTAALGHLYNLKPELAGKIREAILTYDWKGSGLESLFVNAVGSRFEPRNYKNDWSLIRRIDNEIGYQHHID